MSDPQKNKKQALLEAALTMFSENGYQGASTASISALAKVATGTLFHYFGSKENLVNELFLMIKEEFKTAITRGVTEQDSTQKAIRSIWENALLWGAANPKKVSFVMQMKASSHGKNLPMDHPVANENLLWNVYEKGVTNKTLKKASSELLCALWGGLLWNTMDYFRTRPEKLQDARQKEMAFSMYWDLIKF